MQAVLLNGVLSLVVIATAGCAGEPRAPDLTMDGFIAVREPTVLLFTSASDRDEVDWGKCHNLAGPPRLIEAAKRLEANKVRVVVEDVGWPVYALPDGVWSKTIFRGVRLEPNCLLQPYYWLRSVAAAEKS